VSQDAYSYVIVGTGLAGASAVMHGVFQSDVNARNEFLSRLDGR
jgi:hypothetical protein